MPLPKGRHFSGTPIAKSGTQPKPRMGSSSGGFVGTGKNSKTAATPRHSPSPSSGNRLSGKAQLEQFNTQAPEPFRNNAPGAKLDLGTTQQSGGGAAYKPFAGSRVSVSDGYTSKLGGNPSAVGVPGNRGMGRENGNVAGRSQPRRVGNNRNQPKASFYGR